MKKTLVIAVLTTAAFVLPAAPAQAAPNKPNAAWSQQCDKLLPGPWKRIGDIKRCTLVHTPPGRSRR